MADHDANVDELDVTSDAPGHEVSQPQHTLVQIDDDVALVFGRGPLAGFEIEPLSLLDDTTRDAMGETLARGLGLANVSAQAANGVLQAQGLVRLAPETLRALQTMKPLVSGGWNLGTLTSGGKFAAQIRWAPAAGAQAGAFVAALGPALAMVAIQMQLGEIAKLARRNLELTSKVLQVVQADQHARITGLYKELQAELDHARDLGVVSDNIWRTVEVHGTEIQQLADLFTHQLSERVREIGSKTKPVERSQYLRQHYEAIVAEAHGLLLANAARFIWLVLRAGTLSGSEVAADVKLRQRLLNQAPLQLGAALGEATSIVDALEREVAILTVVSGEGLKLPGTGAKRAVGDVQAMARQLLDAIGVVRGGSAPPLPKAINLPTVTVFEAADKIPPTLAELVALRTERGESVLAIADVELGRSMWGDQVYAVVTDRRLLVARQGDFKSKGVIEIEIALGDVRYVRVRDRGEGQTYAVDVTTKDRDLTLEFYGWSKRGPARRAARQFADILAAFMNLPVDEVPIPDVPELLASRSLIESTSVK